MTAVLQEEVFPEVVMPTCSIRKVLKGQKALVTGANSGIGKGIALALAHAGADVVVNFRSNREGAEQVVQEASRCGSRVYAHQADVSDEAQVQAMFQRLFDEFGTIDVLVNNAGVLIPAEFRDITSGDWDRVVDTNLKGAFLCSQAVAPLMLKKGGRIINIASISGLAQPSGMASVSYVASKAGLIGLTRAMALHLGPKVNVNAVAPGTVETEMTKFLTKSEVQGMVDESFTKRLGKPEEVAYACVFLASDEASWITGEVLTVSGGRGMR